VKLSTVRLNAKNGETFTLYPIGDVHLGSANCDKHLFWDTIDEVRTNPNARWIGMGDYAEWIGPRDKRWEAGGVDEMIINLACLDRIGDVYVEKIADMLRPIMDKCWGMGDGNHEQRFNEQGTNLTARIIQAAGGPGSLYLGWESIIRVVFSVGSGKEEHASHIPVRISCAHGWQAGRMDGGKVNQMEKLLAWIDADIYLRGHSHSKFVVPVTRLRTNQQFTKMIAHTCYVAMTGSFLRTYQQDAIGYGERAEYPPTTMGTPRFTLTPHRTDPGAGKKVFEVAIGAIQ